ncbi:MAG: HUIPC motif thioredoxin-like (seleno)protein [Deltaproteobacteria bacterium]
MPCVYMARVVESVAPDFGDDLRVEKIIIKQREGARRFREISASLGRPAPVPSIFIEGQLIFDQTPGPEELRDFLKGLLGRTS